MQKIPEKDAEAVRDVLNRYWTTKTGQKDELASQLYQVGDRYALIKALHDPLGDVFSCIGSAKEQLISAYLEQEKLVLNRVYEDMQKCQRNCRIG